jgi:hypothetical protein
MGSRDHNRSCVYLLYNTGKLKKRNKKNCHIMCLVKFPVGNRILFQRTLTSRVEIRLNFISI